MRALVILVLLLSAVTLVAALALAARLFPEHRSERALAAMVVSIGVLHTAVHGLGWLDLLRPTALAIAVLVLDAGMLALSLLLRPRLEIGELARRAGEVLWLPVTALVETYRARSAAFLALLVTYAILAYAWVLVVLAPSSSWDGLWYHEAMVGLALQFHGFRIVELPTHMEWVNGYPRLSENLMTFASAYGDRTLVDGVPHAMAVTILLGFFVIARRFTRITTDAIGLGCVLLTVPAVVLQLRSTYVDLTVLATILAGGHFATKRELRARDVWLVGISIGLIGATKSNGIVYAGLVGVAALVPLVRTASRHPVLLGHALLALALALALCLPTYVRNYLLHDNPIWPLRYHSERLGIDLLGPHDLTNSHLSFETNLVEAYGVPEPGGDFVDTRRHAFGYGLSYLGAPLALLALFAVVRDWILRRRSARGESYGVLFFFLFLGMLAALTSPGFHWGRYSLPLPAALLLFLAAFLASRPRGISSEGVVLAMFLVNAITLAWAAPRWDVTVATAYELWDLDPEERLYADISPLLLSPESRRWREEHIGPGDVVAVDEEFAFVGNLWTDGFENDVVWVPYRGGAEYLDALDAAGAVWVTVRDISPENRALASDPRWRFQQIAVNEFRLYERVASPPGPETAPTDASSGALPVPVEAPR